MKTATTLPAGITQEMVDKVLSYKSKSEVRFADLPKDDNGDEVLTVIVSVPSRTSMNEFEKWVDKNPGKAKEILINSHLHSHKDEVKADDGLFAGAFDAIAQLIPVRKAVLKNL